MFTPGDKVGAHRIVARIATGGMATVFLAQREGQEGPASYVIIKAIHRQLSSDQSFRAMFLDEARLTQRLRHANVVTAGELGEHHGVLYLVMELVHGVSLRQLLEALAMDGRRLLPEVAVYLAVRTAEGLHAAHTLVGDDGKPLNVVHRDVTPDNILIGFDGGVRMIDFGVAKARDRIAPTSLGVLKGKFGYMAPEQARGNPVDARTDVFALAIVLWETLTSKRAFTPTSDAAALEWARNPSIPAPSTLVAGITPALDAALARALSVDPNGRPASMAELAAELLAACPGASHGTVGHVSMLLATVVTPRVEETRLALPPDVAEVLNFGRPAPNAESLAQLTVKLPDGYVSDFAASEMGPTEVARPSVVMAKAAPPPKAAVAIAPAVKVQGPSSGAYKPPPPAAATTTTKTVPKPTMGLGAKGAIPKPAVAPQPSPAPVEPPTVTTPGAEPPTATTPGAEPPTATTPMAEPPTVTTPGAAHAQGEVLIAPPPAAAEGLVPSTPPPAFAQPSPAHVAPAPVPAPIASPVQPGPQQAPAFAPTEPPTFGGAAAHAAPGEPHVSPIASQGPVPVHEASPAAPMPGAAAPAYAPTSPAAPAQPTASTPAPASSGGAGKKLGLAFFGLVFLGALVGGGYYAYGRYVAAKALEAAGAPPAVPTAPPVVTPPPVAAPTPPPVVAAPTPPPAATVDAGAAIDAAPEAAAPTTPDAAVAPATATATPTPTPAPTTEAPAMQAQAAPPPSSMQSTTPAPTMQAAAQTTPSMTSTAMTSTAMTSTAMTSTTMTAPTMSTAMIARPDF